MKQVAGKLRLDLAQYRELAAFAQFSSDLDPQTRAQLDRGARITEILKQGWEEPMSVSQQILIIWAVTNGFLNAVAVESVKEWEKAYLEFIAVKYPKMEKEIVKEGKISDKTIKAMKKATELFNKLNPKLLDEKLIEAQQNTDQEEEDKN